MATRTQDITLTAGRDSTITLTVYQSDGVSVQDLTGCTVWFTAKRKLGDPDAAAVIALSTATSGVVLTSPTTGVATISVPATSTANINPGTPLYYDVMVKDGSNKLYSPVGGTITLLAPVRLGQN